MHADQFEVSRGPRPPVGGRGILINNKLFTWYYDLYMNIVTVFIVVIVLIAGYLTIAPELSKFGIDVPGISTSTVDVTQDENNNTENSIDFWASTERPEPIVTIEEPQETITPPNGFTLSQLSPYYQKVRIGGVAPPPDNGNESEFTLHVSREIDGTISLAGWRVRSNAGGEVAIPNAIADYNPFGTAKETPIELRQDDYVTVRSETRGTFTKSFRLNKCIGFLDSLYTFDPGLPWSCPALYKNEELETFSGKCQSFIHSLGSCETPSAQKWNESLINNDATCRSIVERYTYSECYRRFHSNDDFFSNEWRTITGVRMPFDQIHDRILLLDAQRLVVDVYAY